jgi:hypothetical protein
MADAGGAITDSGDRTAGIGPLARNTIKLVPLTGVWRPAVHMPVRPGALGGVTP